MCYMCYNMWVELGDWRNVSVDFCCLHAPRKYSVILAIPCTVFIYYWYRYRYHRFIGMLHSF